MHDTWYECAIEWAQLGYAAWVQGAWTPELLRRADAVRTAIEDMVEHERREWSANA